MSDKRKRAIIRLQDLIAELHNVKDMLEDGTDEAGAFDELELQSGTIESIIHDTDD